MPFSFDRLKTEAVQVQENWTGLFSKASSLNPDSKT